MDFVEERKIKILGVEWVNLIERYRRNRREKLEKELVAKRGKGERERGGF